MGLPDENPLSIGPALGTNIPGGTPEMQGNQGCVRSRRRRVQTDDNRMRRARRSDDIGLLVCLYDHGPRGAPGMENSKSEEDRKWTRKDANYG